MRQVIQSSALTILLILVVGDVGAVEEWPLALLGFLLESDYSRGFESEADEYAFERMLAMDMDQAHFGRMLGASPEKTGGGHRGWSRAGPRGKELVGVSVLTSRYPESHRVSETVLRNLQKPVAGSCSPYFFWIAETQRRYAHPTCPGFLDGPKSLPMSQVPRALGIGTTEDTETTNGHES